MLESHGRNTFPRATGHPAPRHDAPRCHVTPHGVKTLEHDSKTQDKLTSVGMESSRSVTANQIAAPVLIVIATVPHPRFVRVTGEIQLEQGCLNAAFCL